ncbi:MAG: hypothetical protein ABW185_29145 [Sedimenticola sp.]
MLRRRKINESITADSCNFSKDPRHRGAVTPFPETRQIDPCTLTAASLLLYDLKRCHCPHLDYLIADYQHDFQHKSAAY